MKTNQDADSNGRDKILQLPEPPKAPAGDAGCSWMAGVIERFKESQRLPLFSRLMKSKDHGASHENDVLDFSSFYHI